MSDVSSQPRPKRNFVLNVRTDAIMLNNDIDDDIASGKAFLAAASTTVFFGGGLARRGLKRDEVVKTLNALECRISVLAKPPGQGLSLQELADIGLVRVSVGPILWRKAMVAFNAGADGLVTTYEEMKVTM